MTVAAGAITQDSDLEPILSPHDLKRLLPRSWSNFDTWHVKAWTEIIQHYANQPTAITEAMMSDTSELVPAAIHHVAAQAFSFARDLEMEKHHHTRYLRQLNMINVSTSDDTTAHGWGGTIEMEMG